MKRLLLVALAITVVSGLILGGLSKADAKTLQYEVWLPPKVPEYKTTLAFYKGLENATKGAVKVQFNPGGAMGKKKSYRDVRHYKRRKRWL